MLPHYDASSPKVDDLLRELRAALGNESATFRCLFLIDDFCGSGRTLLREAVTSTLEEGADSPRIPVAWQSRLRLNEKRNELELLYGGDLSEADRAALLAMGTGVAYAQSVARLIESNSRRATVLKGSLAKVAERDLGRALHPDGSVFLCPLLATEHAVDRLQPLLPRLPGPFSKSRILPGATLGAAQAIRSSTSPIGSLCEKHYTEDMEDRHTGCVKFGFDGCGLPLVLHHNTPNNSIYLLWARRHPGFYPLFVRFERHGREGA